MLPMRAIRIHRWFNKTRKLTTKTKFPHFANTYKHFQDYKKKHTFMLPNRAIRWFKQTRKLTTKTKGERVVIIPWNLEIGSFFQSSSAEVPLSLSLLLTTVFPVSWIHCSSTSSSSGFAELSLLIAALNRNFGLINKTRLQLGSEKDKTKSLLSFTTFGENRCFDAHNDDGGYITSSDNQTPSKYTTLYVINGENLALRLNNNNQ